MEEAVTIPAPAGPRSTLGSLTAAMLFGALVAVTLLYMWGASIAKEEGARTLRPSAEISQ